MQKCILGIQGKSRNMCKGKVEIQVLISANNFFFKNSCTQKDLNDVSKSCLISLLLSEQ